jgi:hypothetical protein
MVDLLSVAGLFGIGFVVVTLLMTAALTWLGAQDEGPASQADVEADDEDAAGA